MAAEMTLTDMAHALRVAGWRVVPPADGKAPETAMGQVWVPTDRGSTATERTVIRMWMDGTDDVVTYADWDAKQSTITRPAWKSWVRKHGARPVTI